MALVRKAADVALGARQVVKDLGRLQEIVQVLARHGLGWLVAEVDVPGVGYLRREDVVSQPTPERLCAVLKELGPTFVKLGQVLSTRDDLIPPEYCEAFSGLQDAVGAIPWEDVVAVLRENFSRGRDPEGAGFALENLFEQFDPTPVATASIAQVHRAVTHDGEVVAVKVQRPGLREKIDTDLSILAFLARQAQAQLPEAGLFDLPAMVGVLRRSLTEETDFRNEASNAEQFAANFEDTDWVTIPRIYRALTGPGVLTMEFLEGTRISRAREAGYDMRLVGERYLSAAFRMLLQDGFFHGDLHPGNVLVLPGGHLGLLDFGMVGRLSPENKQDLVDIFYAVQRRDGRTIARIYWELAIKPAHVDYAAWEADVQELMERQFFGKAMAEIQVADFLRDLMRRASRHGVRSTPAYTMFFKALITTEGLAKMLIPEVDPIDSMRPYVERMAAQQYSVDRLQREVMYWLMSFRYSSRRLPVVASQLVADLQEGRLRLRSVVEPGETAVRSFEQATRRLTLALIFAGAYIGAGMAAGEPGARIFGLPLVATLGYLVAAGALGLLGRTWLR